MKSNSTLSVPRALLAICLFAGAAALLVGCGDSKGTLHGKVTYLKKGQSIPVTGGTISFYDSKGHPVISGTIAAEGTFNISEVPRGKWKVTVNTASAKTPRDPTKDARNDPRAAAKKKDAPLPERARAAGIYVKIPSKFLHPSSSGVTIEVKGGDQEADIVLKD
jgi:hypothetical protein